MAQKEKEVIIIKFINRINPIIVIQSFKLESLFRRRSSNEAKKKKKKKDKTSDF